jgi:hypothetical protein
MPLALEEDEATNPIDVRSLGAQACNASLANASGRDPAIWERRWQTLGEQSWKETG